MCPPWFCLLGFSFFEESNETRRGVHGGTRVLRELPSDALTRPPRSDNCAPHPDDRARDDALLDERPRRRQRGLCIFPFKGFSFTMDFPVFIREFSLQGISLQKGFPCIRDFPAEQTWSCGSSLRGSCLRGAIRWSAVLSTTVVDWSPRSLSESRTLQSSHPLKIRTSSCRTLECPDSYCTST